MGELEIAERRLPQDGRVSIRFAGSPMDLRMDVLPTTYGEKVILRIAGVRKQAAAPETTEPRLRPQGGGPWGNQGFSDDISVARLAGG
jgi:type II secretory ATPase GspE/PulE/Tfp pilus assembly ATPase PilB-like protein